jgi:hypothetical protein
MESKFICITLSIIIMFSLSGPWLVYAASSIVFLVIYYSVISYVFYRRDLIKWFKTLRRTAPADLEQKNNKQSSRILPPQICADNPPSAFKENTDDAKESDSEHLMLQTEKITEKIKIAIKAASQRQYAREDLISILEMITVDYHQLQGTPLQLLVNTTINALCQEHGLAPLDSSERAHIWQTDNDQLQKETKLLADDEPEC